jgi:hypothetical protein
MVTYYLPIEFITFYRQVTPFPTFPQGGRRIKTFPPWGKMKGGKNQ